MTEEWTRIPQPIDNDQDRRAMCGILTAAGLEVRIVKVRKSSGATPKRFIEYRDTGLVKPLTGKAVQA